MICLGRFHAFPCFSRDVSLKSESQSKAEAFGRDVGSTGATVTGSAAQRDTGRLLGGSESNGW